MPLHVAHFVPRYPPALGGAESYARRLSEYLTAAGDSVTVWTTTAVTLEEMWTDTLRRERASGTGGPLARSRRRGTPAGDRSVVSVTRYFPLTFPLRRYVLKAISLFPIRTLQSLAQPVNPICPAMWRDVHRFSGPLDAVHAFAFPYSFPIVCALRLARRRRVPFLLTPFLHLGDPTDPRDRTRRQYTRPHLKWLLRQADAVFAQTESERGAVVELGVPEDRAVLQGLGVDAVECTGGGRARARCQWGVSDTEMVVGHLANNSVEKGTVDLLNAAADTGTRVVLAGPEMPNFRHFWDTFPRKELVTRLGPLTEEQKRDFFAGIDVFALPSRTDSFGLVLLEAWANGVPVLAYRAGGPADLVRHGVDGFLAKCGDVTDLANRLSELTTDAALRSRLGDAGRARVATDFRWPDKLRVVTEVLERLANPPRSQARGDDSPPVVAASLRAGQ